MEFKPSDKAICKGCGRECDSYIILSIAAEQVDAYHQFVYCSKKCLWKYLKDEMEESFQKALK